MIYLYLENKPEFLSVEKSNALPALESQVLEIFSKLNSSETTVLGLIIDDNLEIKISSFSKFLWKIDFTDLKIHKKKKGYYSTQKVIKIIKDLFNDINPMEKNNNII